MKENQFILIGGRRKISAEMILMLKADINYTVVFMKDGSNYLSSTNISKLETRLKEHDFFRPNRSVIINLDSVIDFKENLAQIKMENDENISLSRRKKKGFIEMIEKFSPNLKKELSW